MRGDRALRVCMQILVLLNLVFVQLTGAAGLHWLAPLFALALCAPLLERFRERLVYRSLWNAGVVGFSLLLVRHAMRAELANVLEDGLVLAVLCQVHLLNNLRSKQRPDLLFFNAFLIAIIAGYMNREVGFPVAFLIFAPCFVVGLQLLNATARSAAAGGPELSRATTVRIALDGARRSAFLLAASLLVFLFWPRDFERKAFFHGRFEMGSERPTKLEVGFSEELVLGRRLPVESSDAPALRVKLLAGPQSAVSSLWRGATLATTTAGEWHAMDSELRRATAASDDPWISTPGRLLRLGPAGVGGAQVEVGRFAQGTERLFAPLHARAVQLPPELANTVLRGRLDGTLDTARTADMNYEVSLGKPLHEPGGPRPSELEAELAPYVALPESGLSAPALELARRLEAELPEESEQHELVARFRDHLAREYTYLPPGTEGAATSLDRFLRGEAGGHCEFFASALATMLRTCGVPCRVVTGFRSTRWNSSGDVLTFGTRDAHAWVEVHDPSAGWYAVDPSPMVVGPVAGLSLWTRVSSTVRSLWESVAGFDSDRRAATFAWARALPARTLRAAREHPLDALLVGLLLALPGAWFVQRRLARIQPAVRAYRTALRRARLRALPGETPRELMARARTRDLSPARLRALEDATERHEEERYAA